MTTSTLATHRDQSGLDLWEWVTRPPHPLLRPYVRSYTGFVERVAEPVRRVHVPTVVVPLIINFDTDWTVRQAGQPSAVYDSFVAGIHERYVVTRAAGSVRCMQIDFTPLGAGRVLGLPLGEIANRVVAPGDILRPAADLIERLREAPGWDERFDLLDRFILRRAHAADPAPPAVAWAWQQLESAAGDLRIAELAAELGWSRKHLGQQFRRQLGLPPKTLARILRFNHAIARLARADQARWAEIAHDCGYYDQAHLVRDFNDLAGCTPTEFAARRLPGGAGVAAG